jgi:hypothetical protein
MAALEAGPAGTLRDDLKPLREVLQHLSALCRVNI